MDPLELLMRPVARLLNRNIGDSLQARDLIREMDGQVVAVKVRDTGLAAFFVIDSGVVELRTAFDGEPGATVSGSLPGLARMASGGSEALIRDGSVRLEGDPATAQSFQKLLTLAQPDLEEELSRVIGDTAAHGLGEFARGFADWGKRARSTMEQNLKEYLQEESRELPSRDEADDFRRKLNTLRDDVDRLEARLRLLEEPDA